MKTSGHCKKSVLFSIMIHHFSNWEALLGDNCYECVLSSLLVMTLAWIARGQGSIPQWGPEFFGIANCHLFDSLLHLVANVISKLETHEDILSPWRGQCDSDQCILDSLVIMILAQIMRFQGSIPSWDTEFSRIPNDHLFDPLLH